MLDCARKPESAPVCPGPLPTTLGPTKYIVPKGAVDTHAHVIGVPPDYPFVESRSYTPPEASAASYLSMLDQTGMTYGVLVQVSVHGTDNRLMVETLRANRERLRGIAVIPLGLPGAELLALREAGVVGLRLNVLYGGGIGLDDLNRYGALCREMGWHLQFLVDARELPTIASKLIRLPVPIVFDHVGHFPADVGVKAEGFRTLVSLVRDGGWVKLSGAFRNTVAGPPYSDTIPYVQQLVDAAPHRCLWGSDWPHVANWNYMPNVSELLDLLADWVPDEAVRRRVLVGNPRRLYEFKEL